MPPPTGGKGGAREDVTARLISHFKELIRKGEIQPGNRLPPERELADQLEVNRGSLRQALKVLQVMGVLAQRVGDGTYLCADARQILREPMDFLLLMSGVSNDELFDLRLFVEPELAAAAAAKASTANLVELLSAVDALERSRSTEQRIDADLAFHEAIFRAAGNNLCLLIFTVIQRAVLQSMKHSARLMKQEATLKAHRLIFQAIDRRDPQAARAAMVTHLAEAKASLHTPAVNGVDAVAPRLVKGAGRPRAISRTARALNVTDAARPNGGRTRRG
jgi:GntR family transcriptional repressor for pyruvate dehydrogenase complex